MLMSLFYFHCRRFHFPARRENTAQAKRAADEQVASQKLGYGRSGGPTFGLTRDCAGAVLAADFQADIRQPGNDLLKKVLHYYLVRL